MLLQRARRRDPAEVSTVRNAMRVKTKAVAVSHDRDPILTAPT